MNRQSEELSYNDFNFKDSIYMTSRSPMPAKCKIFSQQLEVDDRKKIERRMSFLNTPQEHIPKHHYIKRSVTLRLK